MRRLFSGLLLFFCVTGCEETAQLKQRSYSLIRLDFVRNITVNGAELGATAEYIGSDRILDHGFVFNTIATNPPSIKDLKISFGDQVGSTITSNLIYRWIPNQTYVVRAFIQNENTVSYSEEFRFVAPGTAPWTKTSGSMVVAGQQGTGFTIDDLGYILLGSYQSALITPALFEYNSTTDVVTGRADFPGGRRNAPTSFSIGRKGYVGTGSSAAQTYTSDFYEYDADLQTWRQVTGLDALDGLYNATGFSVNGKGYVGFGYKKSPTNNSPVLSTDFFEYNPVTNEWTKFAGPGSTSASTNGFTIGDRGYVLVDGRELWMLNPDLTWTRKADCPNAALGAFSFVADGKAYVGAGRLTSNMTVYSHTCSQYDPAYDGWSVFPFNNTNQVYQTGWGFIHKGIVIGGAGPDVGMIKFQLNK